LLQLNVCGVGGADASMCWFWRRHFYEHWRSWVWSSMLYIIRED